MVGGNPPDRRGNRPGNADGFQLPWDEDQGQRGGRSRNTPQPPRQTPPQRPGPPAVDPYQGYADEYEDRYQDPYESQPPTARNPQPRGPFPPQRQQPAPPPPQHVRRPAPPSQGYDDLPYPGQGSQPAGPRRQTPPPGEWEPGDQAWDTPSRPQRGPGPWPSSQQLGYDEDGYPDQDPYAPVDRPQYGRPERSPYRPADDDWEEDAPSRGRSRRSSRRERRDVGVPPALSGALAAIDVRLLLLGGAGVLSVILMAAFGAVRIAALPEWFPMHHAANGVVDIYGTSSTLWRLPFGLGVVTAMNIGASIILGSRERFASLLFLGSLVLIHVVAWLAFVQIAF